MSETPAPTSEPASEGTNPAPNGAAADWVDRSFRVALRPSADPEGLASERRLAERVLERAESLWRDYDANTPPKLVDRYELQEEIGHGGMGVVYRAVDKTLGREVAIKTIRRRAQDIAEVRSRFVEEAKVSSSLEHPGIVPIHDLVFSVDGAPFFVMKLIRGRTFQSLLTDSKTTGAPRRALLQVFESACQAIAYAHAKGVLHRDIKPSNVMVGEFGEVHVLDWGLVKIAAGTTESLAGENSGEFSADATRFGDVLGTAAYMSPEQALGEVQRISSRTDVFNLGAMLLEILTGEPPYPGPDSRSEVRRARNGCSERAAAQLAASGIEAGLREIVLACLEFDPESRPKDAGELTRRLAEHLTSESERIRRSEIAAVEARAAAAHERRVRFITMGAASILLLLGYWSLRTAIDAEDTRRAHALSNDRRIASALHQAELLRAGSESATTPDLAKLRAALAASDEAAQLASDPDASSDVRARSIALRSELTALVDEVEREANLRTKLDYLRIRTDHDPDPRLLREATLAELASAGIDVENGEIAELAARVRTMRGAARIVEALDDYLLSQSPGGGITPQTNRVVALANALDTEPTRQAIREAFAHGDHAALTPIAATAIEGLPSETYLLLARALGRLGESAAAIAIFEVAVKRFPGVARIRHDFAVALSSSEQKAFDDAARELEFAIAIEPENLHFAGDRAQMALLAHHFASAANQLDELLERNPLRAMSWATLGDLLLEQGEPTLASRAHSFALELEPHGVGLQIRRLESLVASARFDECVRLFESLGAELPQPPGMPNLIAAAYLDIGEFSRAKQFAEIAVRTGQAFAGPNPRVFKSEVLLDFAERALSIEESGGLRPDLLTYCADSQQALAIALFASRRNHFHFATQAYRLVDERFPKDFQRFGISCRLHAIWTALSSGLGLGEDSIGLREDEKRADRERAHKWFEEELAAATLAFDEGRTDLQNTRMFCSFLTHDPRMEHAFDALTAAVIPARERLKWDAARANLDALLARLGPVHSVDLDHHLERAQRARTAR